MSQGSLEQVERETLNIKYLHETPIVPGYTGTPQRINKLPLCTALVAALLLADPPLADLPSHLGQRALRICSSMETGLAMVPSAAVTTVITAIITATADIVIKAKSRVIMADISNSKMHTRPLVSVPNEIVTRSGMGLAVWM